MSQLGGATSAFQTPRRSCDKIRSIEHHLKILETTECFLTALSSSQKHLYIYDNIKIFGIDFCSDRFIMSEVCCYFLLLFIILYPIYLLFVIFNML